MKSKIEKWEHKSSEFWENVSDDELIQHFEQCGFKVTKVPEGEGGVFDSEGNNIKK